MEIPLNNHGFDDFIAWNFSTNGQVLPPTVASQIWSGYHLQWRHKFGPSASQLAIPGLAVSNPVWQIIWKLKVPNKVKIFIWRALHGIVPLKAILANRHVGKEGGGPICNNAAEDILHMVFKCPMAKDLWELLNLTQVIDVLHRIDQALWCWKPCLDKMR
jgi:hypothetical protein